MKISVRVKSVHIALLVSLFSSAQMQAQMLNEVQLFRRCYAHITGHPVPLNNTQMILVKAGSLLAVDACAALLDKAKLGADGKLVTVTDESKYILDNFNSLHRSWFPNLMIENMSGYDSSLYGNHDLYDPTEPALMITYNLFSNKKYNEILTTTKGVHAFRQEDSVVKSTYWTGVSPTFYQVTSPSRRILGKESFQYDFNEINFLKAAWDYKLGFKYDGSQSDFITMPKIEVGELVGIRPTTESFTIPNAILLSPGSSNVNGSKNLALRSSFDFYQNLGGGIIGMPSFMLVNFGHPLYQHMDGALKLPRKWAQTIMTTFLCSNLPALRESDISAHISKDLTSVPFRQSNSCLMCHSNLDQMAMTARNFVIGKTDVFLSVSNLTAAGVTNRPKSANLILKYNSSLPNSGWPDKPTAEYYKQAPQGKLYFRTFSGDLVNRDVNSMAELGSAISEQNDFYQCATKRYFKYFTGIDVPLYDRMDPRNAILNKSLSPETMQYRKFIEDLAIEFQSHQSQAMLIKSIIQSNYYRNRNYQSQWGR